MLPCDSENIIAITAYSETTKKISIDFVLIQPASMPHKLTANLGKQTVHAYQEYVSVTFPSVRAPTTDGLTKPGMVAIPLVIPISVPINAQHSRLMQPISRPTLQQFNRSSKQKTQQSNYLNVWHYIELSFTANRIHKWKVCFEWKKFVRVQWLLTSNNAVLLSYLLPWVTE